MANFRAIAFQLVICLLQKATLLMPIRNNKASTHYSKIPFRSACLCCLIGVLH